MPCTMMVTPPSGIVMYLMMRAIVPTRYRSLAVGSSTSLSRCAMTPMGVLERE